jgi:PST family polysaccharide transporter
MTKEKRFKTIAYRTLFCQLLCGVIACFGALHGWGIYALIITPIFTAIGVFAVNFYNYPQKLFCRVDFHVLRQIASFSSYQFLFQFSNYFSRNLDKLIIGKYFNMAQLGYYDKSYRLMQLPLQSITFVISPVLHPILSSLQNDKENLSQKCCKLANLLSCISFPIGVLFYFIALEVIRIVYGPNWDAAAPVFSILALSLPLQMVLSSIGSFYQSAGDTKRMFLSGLLNTTITVAGFIIAAVTVHTIESMAWAWVITLTINFVTSYNILFRVTFKVRAVGFFKLFIPQFINSTVAFLGCMAVSHFAESQSVVVSLIIKTVFLLIATLIMAYILGQYNIFTLLKQARARWQYRP